MKKIIILTFFIFIILLGCDNRKIPNNTRPIENETLEQTPGIAEEYPQNRNDLSSEPDEQTQMEDPQQMKDMTNTKQDIQEELKDIKEVHDVYWSLDGNTVVYVLNNNIYLRKVGENTGKIISSYYLGNMVWSKDNSKIAFIRKDNENTIVSIYDISLGKITDVIRTDNKNEVYKINKWDEENKITYTVISKNKEEKKQEVLYIK